MSAVFKRRHPSLQASCHLKRYHAMLQCLQPMGQLTVFYAYIACRLGWRMDAGGVHFTMGPWFRWRAYLRVPKYNPLDFHIFFFEALHSPRSQPSLIASVSTFSARGCATHVATQPGPMCLSLRCGCAAVRSAGWTCIRGPARHGRQMMYVDGDLMCSG